MRGDKVIVRSYGGEPLIRRVWDTQGDMVIVCSDKNFEWLSLNDGSGSHIGFPNEDVFAFDETALIEFEDSPELWEHLAPYREGEQIA